MEDKENAGEQRCADEGSENDGLDLVEDEGSSRGLVESEPLFEDKGVVDRERKVEEIVAEKQGEDVNEASRDIRKTQRATPLVQPCEPSEKPEGEKDGQGSDG